MSDDHADKFYVTMQYEQKHVFESQSIVECVRFAAAAAMHTGKSFGVHRENRTAGETPHDFSIRSSPLVTVGASHIDYRAVRAETPLILKAFAHELVSNIDEIAPEFTKEGPWR